MVQLTFDLYAITGLPRDVSATRLRYVYEEHVADAAGTGNHRRLLELSQAFDALPRSVQLAMYSNSGVSAAAPAASPLPPHVRTDLRLRAKRHRRAEAATCPTNRWRQPVSRGTVVTAVLVVSILGAVQFDRATHHSDDSAAGLTTTQSPIDARAIALELDRDNSRDDITCQSIGSSTTNQLTCEASDGQAWLVTMHGAPDRFTATVTRPSVYAQSARVDLQMAISSVQMCRHQSGVLPPTATGQSGQTHLQCAGGITTLYLHPGDLLDYHRISRKAFTITVTASDGEEATYRSSTDKITH